LYLTPSFPAAAGAAAGASDGWTDDTELAAEAPTASTEAAVTVETKQSMRRKRMSPPLLE
jgi:hypothetical protein